MQDSTRIKKNLILYEPSFYYSISRLPNRRLMILKNKILVALLLSSALIMAQSSAEEMAAPARSGLSTPLQIQTPEKRKEEQSDRKSISVESSKQKTRAKTDADDGQDDKRQAEISRSGVKQPEYWYNTYIDSRNSFLRNDGKIDLKEEKALENIVSESIKNAPGNFYCNYILLRQNRNEASADIYMSLLEKQNLQPGLIAAEKAWMAERANNKELRDKAMADYYYEGMMSPVQIKMAEWMLDAAEDGSVIITNGEFDTYPLWYKGGNKTVCIISFSMMEDKTWLKNKLHQWDPSLNVAGNIPDRSSLIDLLLKSKKPVYMSWSVGAEFLKKYTSDLFPVGPLVRVSKIPVNNIAALEKFYHNKDLPLSLEKFKQVKNSDPFIQTLSNLYPGLGILKKRMETMDLFHDQVSVIEDLLNNLTGKSISK